MKFLDDESGDEDEESLLVCCLVVVSDEPVSIWTTCLKLEESAWTKVVA